jgi:hypothetical protein
MSFDHVDLIPVAEEPESFIIGMAFKAHVVVVQDGFFKILRISYERPVTVWIVALPTGKLLNFTVNAFLILYFNILKMIVGIGFVVAVTIQTDQPGFQPGFHGMGEGVKIPGVAIRATEGFMNRGVIQIPVHTPVFTHGLTKRPAHQSILQHIGGFPMAT